MLKYVLIYLYVCSVRMYVCEPHAWLVPRGQKEVLELLELELHKNGYEPPCVCWKSTHNPGLLIAEPSLKSYLFHFKVTFYKRYLMHIQVHILNKLSGSSLCYFMPVQCYTVYMEFYNFITTEMLLVASILFR